ncbi:hypothetical protein EJ06DRAFT_554427 [Trichodelitschia bisporula]|uniref:Cyclin N-terminal domain-containing protein n=1 Tax=Trichodelitschia bisporula TaxID=703511 RepID=A0A6G1I418_9PEZI|nr:hypothetical protein EJ06DRAFT_554427 [Trichodelitschia bisporula]
MACPSRYGPCDTFFVQEDDVYSVAERARDRARAIARVQHRQFGQELSRITADEYQEDILDHMEVMETMPDVSSIDLQTEIQWYMRPYLLDFLVEAHSAFQLLPETWFLAVNLLDRYCSRRVVYKRHYQLVGCVSLLIAAKYGDKKERVPTIRELRSMCCSLYDEEMFLQMEGHVLQTLTWVVGHPTADSFLQIALADTGSSEDIELQNMTWYFCEMALFHKDFVGLRPSVLARCALVLARFVLNRPQAPANTWAGTYEYSIVCRLCSIAQEPTQVVQRKYSTIHFSSVTQTLESWFYKQTLQAQAENSNAQIAQEPREPAAHVSKVAPQTPQKHGYAMQHGCMTPPITPEDNSMDYSYDKMAVEFPPTPSPVPQAYGYNTLPQRFDVMNPQVQQVHRMSSMHSMSTT